MRTLCPCPCPYLCLCHSPHPYFSFLFSFLLLLSLVHAANDARACYASGSIADSIRMLQDIRRKAEQLERRLLTLTDDHSKNQVGCHALTTHPHILPSFHRRGLVVWMPHLFRPHTRQPIGGPFLHLQRVLRFVLCPTVVGLPFTVFFIFLSLSLSLSSSTPFFSSFARTTQWAAPFHLFHFPQPTTHEPIVHNWSSMDRSFPLGLHHPPFPFSRACIPCIFYTTPSFLCLPSLSRIPPRSSLFTHLAALHLFVPFYFIHNRMKSHNVFVVLFL